MTVQTVYDLIQTVAPFDTQMDYDNSGLLVGSPSQEVKNILFGGEGFFNTVVTGPGKVVLQSMPISTMAMKLYQYMPFTTSST